MEDVIEWFASNYKWVFSGIGVVILGAIFSFFRKSKSNGISQKQRSGNNSINIQAGNNVEFTKKNDE